MVLPMENHYVGKDKRQPNVLRTITAIRAMGLDCDRTTRSGEYRIAHRDKHGNVIAVKYAITDHGAIALARLLCGFKPHI